MRTWDENKEVIHQLWPQHQFTEEEAKLWREDLGSLDQAMLYDAIRNAKRTHDTAWVHLRWIVEEYNALKTARRRATHKIPKGEKLDLKIDSAESQKLCDQFLTLIDVSQPSDFESIEKRVVAHLDKIESAAALRVLSYARQRLLGKVQQFGRVTRDGDIEPLGFGGAF